MMFQDFLKQEFHIRKSKNQNYSLRAFARDLKVDAAMLSKVISGKSPCSISFGASILKSIKAPEELEAKLIYSLYREFQQRKAKHIDINIYSLRASGGQ